ncbi:MAG: hypothetical protein ACLT4G_12630 [Escherichia coli]|nr:hypothetical protein [Escherichia coli]HBK0986866.1 hypothetical protein [Escherichia coli]
MEMLIQLLTRFGDKISSLGALGVVGPILLLLSLYPFFQYGWSSYVTYSALGLMVAVSLWDIFSPANKRCDDDSCAV